MKSKNLIGKTVYTVNAKTKKVDSWTCVGSIPTADELLIQLVNGKKTTFLPIRCIFTSKEDALKIINKK